MLYEVITLMPENIRVYYNLGLLYDKNHQPKKAEKTFLDALKIEPENESLLYALVYHYYNNGEIEKAKNNLKTLTQLYPNNAQYQNLLQSLN